MGCPKLTYNLAAEPRLSCVYNAADEEEGRVVQLIPTCDTTGALLNGANFGQIMNAGAIGAFWGGLSAGVNFGVGALADKGMGLVGKMYAHGISQGALTAAQGGKFQHGFFSAALTAGLAPGIMKKVGSPACRVLASSIVGGTASVLGGGKFAVSLVIGILNQLMMKR